LRMLHFPCLPFRPDISFDTATGHIICYRHNPNFSLRAPPILLILMLTELAGQQSGGETNMYPKEHISRPMVLDGGSRLARTLSCAYARRIALVLQSILLSFALSFEAGCQSRSEKLDD